MHPLVIRSLADLGVPFLEQTIRQSKSNQKGVFHFKLIMDHLAQQGCLTEVVHEMKTTLLNLIYDNPLLNEFRSDGQSTLCFEIDSHDHCIIKENGTPLLTCSREAPLGELCLAYYHLLQLENPTETKEVQLEFAA